MEVSSLRYNELMEVQKKVDDILAPFVKFSALGSRKRRNLLKTANEVFSSFLGKLVGPDKADQAGYLLMHLKRVHQKGGHMTMVLDDLDRFPDYSALSTTKRKYLKKTAYKLFDKTLSKISGSDDQDTHRKFLNARYYAIHHASENFKPLTEEASWMDVKASIERLWSDSKSIMEEKSIEVPRYSTLTKKQKNRRKIKNEVLDLMITILAGSDKLEEHRALLEDRLQRLHHRKYIAPFSYQNMRKLIDNLEPLEKFKNTNAQKTKHKFRYSLASKLIDKLVGSVPNGGRREYSTRSAFLLAFFPESFQFT